MRKLLSIWIGLFAFCFTLNKDIHAQVAVPQQVDEELPSLCSGDIFQYRIFNAGISYWEWSFNPSWAIPMKTHTGPNGFQISGQLYNPTPAPLQITGTFIGYKIGSHDILTKKIIFWVIPSLQCAIQKDIPLDASNSFPAKVKLGKPN